VNALEKSSVKNGEVSGGDVKAEQQSAIKGTKAMTGNIEAKEQSAIIGATAVMGDIKAEILSSIKNSTAELGSITAEIQSAVFDSSAPVGTVTADFLSIAMNNDADLIAKHRSILTDVHTGKDASLETQSAGDVLVTSVPDCDPSSSVFDDFNALPDLAESCLENDLDHFFNQIDFLDTNLFDSGGHLDNLYQELKAFIQAVKDALP